MIIIITIICCGVQVHLLLSEKVKVSQTSQSRPAALTTALHTTLCDTLYSTVQCILPCDALHNAL